MYCDVLTHAILWDICHPHSNTGQSKSLGYPRVYVYVLSLRVRAVFEVTLEDIVITDITDNADSQLEFTMYIQLALGVVLDGEAMEQAVEVSRGHH